VDFFIDDGNASLETFFFLFFYFAAAADDDATHSHTSYRKTTRKRGGGVFDFFLFSLHILHFCVRNQKVTISLSPSLSTIKPHTFELHHHLTQPKEIKWIQ